MAICGKSLASAYVKLEPKPVLNDNKWKVTGITQNKVQNIIDNYKNSSTNNGTRVSISNTEEGKKNFSTKIRCVRGSF